MITASKMSGTDCGKLLWIAMCIVNITKIYDNFLVKYKLTDFESMYYTIQ